MIKGTVNATAMMPVRHGSESVYDAYQSFRPLHDPSTGWCWRGGIGRRSRITLDRANAHVGSTPTASTAAPLTRLPVALNVFLSSVNRQLIPLRHGAGERYSLPGLRFVGA